MKSSIRTKQTGTTATSRRAAGGVAQPRAIVESIEPRVLLSGSVLSTIADFNGTNGAGSNAGLLMDAQGNLYGITPTGGADSDGTVFEIAAGTHTITTLATFNGANGKVPAGKLIMDAQGNLYGATNQGGGYNDGTVFEIAAGTNTLTTLATFDGTADVHATNPSGGLVMDAQGNLYGATSSGGPYSEGTIYRVAAGTDTLSNVATFLQTNGRQPVGSPVMDANGNLYGATNAGGIYDSGIVYEIPGSTNVIETLGVLSGVNGWNPLAGIVMDSAGNIYGTAERGGANNDGTVFEVAANSLTATTLATFNGANGSNPEGDLYMDAQGNLYGTTLNGGANNDGTVFEIAHGDNLIITRASFDGTHGANPAAGLVMDTAGNLFGTTSVGGANSDGTVFELTPPAPPSHVAITAQPADATAGAALSISASVEDVGGDVVLTDGSTVTLSIASGPAGAALGGTTSVAAHEGVATFNNVWLTRAGTYTLTASDGSLSSDTSVTFTIAPAAASWVSFAQQPTSMSAGGTISPVTVEVRDPYGNVVAGDNSNVTLGIASGPAGAILGGTTTVAAQNGVATFDELSLTQAGTYTLSASDGSLGSDTSASFAVTSDSMTITDQPANVQAGKALQPLDLSLGTSAAGTTRATVSIYSGPGVLLGGTQVRVRNGQAIFRNLKIRQAGTYVLEISAGTLGAVATDTFQVMPSQPARLTFVQQPADTAAGDAISVQVEMRDRFGNVVSDDNSSVTIDADPARPILSGTLTESLTNGTASFDDLSLNTPGTYRLLARDGHYVARSVAFKVV